MSAADQAAHRRHERSSGNEQWLRADYRIRVARVESNDSGCTTQGIVGSPELDNKQWLHKRYHIEIPQDGNTILCATKQQQDFGSQMSKIM